MNRILISILFTSLLSFCFSEDECDVPIYDSLYSCGDDASGSTTPWQPGWGICLDETCGNAEACILFPDDDLYNNFWPSSNDADHVKCTELIADLAPYRNTCCFFSGDGVITSLQEECDPGSRVSDTITYPPNDGNCGTGNCNDEIPSVCIVNGCTDNSACNYNAESANDDGSCTYAEENYDCDGNCIVDTDEDGVCDENELSIDDELIPTNYNINTIYPNPFNPITTISFSIPQSGMVSLKVYDITGRVTTTLKDEYMNVGYYDISWDASSSPSGIYFVKMISDGFIQTEKVVLVK